MDEKGLGHRLQAARKAAGLTQQMLCQKAGLSYSTLAKIERGAIKSPSIFTIQSIAASLGMTLDDLIGASQATQPVNAKTRSKSGVSFIYFDVHGCLIRSYNRAFTKIAALINEPADVIESSFWHYNDQVCRGDLGLDQFNEILAKQFKIDSFDWKKYYLEAVEPSLSMQELLTWASQHYKVGLLTNIMPTILDDLISHKLIPDIQYDAIVDSSKVHAIKPEAKIYEVAQAKARCEPGEILLIDDSRTNLIAAEKLGWHVIWVDDSNNDESVDRIRQALEPDENALVSLPAESPAPLQDQASKQIVELPAL